MKRSRPSFLALPKQAPPAKKARRNHTPAWISAQACGVSAADLEKVFWFMRQKGYTATRQLPGCVCMDAWVDVCCTDEMRGREAMCTSCTHACLECGEPNLELFKSAEDTPVCYQCAGYSCGDHTVWWEDADWARLKKKNKE